MSEIAALIPILAVHLVLTALPGVAAALTAARAGERRAPVLLAVGLAATGVVALVSWWAYYADPQIGESVSWLVLLGSLLLIGVSLRAGRPDAALLRALATPLALWMLGSAFLVFFGFLYGGTDYALTTATTRFSGPLPSDNRIPFYFAEWFYTYGHHELAPVFPPEWLSSDRPPLEQGYVVSQRAFGWAKPELHFQVLGVVLQQLWIVGLWALLLAARVGRLTRGLAMLTVLLSNQPGDRQRLLRLAEAAAGGDAARRGGADRDAALAAAAPRPARRGARRPAARARPARPRLERLRGDRAGGAGGPAWRPAGLALADRRRARRRPGVRALGRLPAPRRPAG
jgi:hypothetical protein